MWVDKPHWICGMDLLGLVFVGHASGIYGCGGALYRALADRSNRRAHDLNHPETRRTHASGRRRRGYLRRPPTPPYVRFRIRRFMKTEVAASEFAIALPLIVIPIPVCESRQWVTPGSNAMPRHSTMVHGH